MKVKVTLMTENDKHVDDSLSDEEVHELAFKGWKVVVSLLNASKGETCELDSVEVIER